MSQLTRKLRKQKNGCQVFGFFFFPLFLSKQVSPEVQISLRSKGGRQGVREGGREEGKKEGGKKEERRREERRE